MTCCPVAHAQPRAGQAARTDRTLAPLVEPCRGTPASARRRIAHTYMVMAYVVMAYVVMAYVGMACVFMALHSYGLYSYGVYSYGPI